MHSIIAFNANCTPPMALPGPYLLAHQYTHPSAARQQSPIQSYSGSFKSKASILIDPITKHADVDLFSARLLPFHPGSSASPPFVTESSGLCFNRVFFLFLSISPTGQHILKGHLESFRPEQSIFDFLILTILSRWHVNVCRSCPLNFQKGRALFEYQCNVKASLSPSPS